MKHLADKIHTIGRCWRIYRRMVMLTAMKKMAYPFNFLLMVSSVVLSIFFILLFADVIYKQIDSIAGLRYEQILILIGSYLLMDGFSWLTFWGGLSELRRNINNGTFDFVVVKPIDSQFFQTIARVDLEDVAKLVIGLFLIISNALKLQFDFSFANIILYILLLVNGWVIFYSFSSIAFSVVFWVNKADSQWRFINTFLHMSQYPTDIYKGVVKVIFTFLIPLAFLATAPTKILTRPIDWLLVSLSFTVAAIFFIIARLVWTAGLKKYSSAGG